MKKYINATINVAFFEIDQKFDCKSGCGRVAMGELLRSGVRGFPNSGGQRPPQMQTVWLLTRGAPRKLVGVWGVDVEVFSWVRFSAFTWYFTWWESCTLKCAIYILLIFSYNISIVLDQITIFKTSISAEVTVLSQSSKCALLSLFHLSFHYKLN